MTTEDSPRPYWVHLVWTLYFFMLTVLFWWCEFRLESVAWSLPIYLVVIVYATLLFFGSIVIQPVQTEAIGSFKEYYYAKRRWIFGLFIAIWMWDFVDTVSKDTVHFASLGAEYVITNSIQMTLALIAMISANERLHEVIAIVCLAMFLTFQYRTFFMLS